MNSSIDRTMARSTKGWIGGEHLGADRLDKLLLDCDAEYFLNSKVRRPNRPEKTLRRPFRK